MPSRASAAASGNATSARALRICAAVEPGTSRIATATSSRAGSVIPGRRSPSRGITTGSAATASVSTSADRTAVQSDTARQAATSTNWQPHGKPGADPGAGSPGIPSSPCRAAQVPESSAWIAASRPGPEGSRSTAATSSRSGIDHHDGSTQPGR